MVGFVCLFIVFFGIDLLVRVISEINRKEDCSPKFLFAYTCYCLK